MGGNATEPEKPKYTTNVGDLVAVMITGSVGRYIAEVVQSEPLILKVEEYGPYAHLRGDDFIINAWDSAIIQDLDESKSTALLKEAKERGHPFLSGLRKLGIGDGKMHEILPTEQ